MQREVDDATSSATLPSITIRPEATWANETFAETICTQLAAESVGDLTIYATGTTGDSTVFFLLPECFYNLASNLSSFAARNLIIQGNSSLANQSDPLKRLPAGLVTLDMQTVVLVNPTTTYSGQSYPYATNWSDIFASFANLQQLALAGAGLTGSLPSSLPSTISHFDVSRNALTGTIPSSILASSASNLSEIVLNLSNNNLSGSISSGLLASIEEVENVVIDLSSNNLTGTIPAALFDVSPLANLEVVYVSFADNALEGSIPASFLTSSLYAAASVTFDVSSNRLNGTVSAALFSELENLAAVAFNASSNNISGSVPNFWPSMNSTGLSSASFSLSNNQLTGSVLTDLVATSTVTGLQSIEWDLRLNSLSGAIPSGLFGPSTSNLARLKIALDGNDLTGSLPTDLFSTANFSSAYTIILSLASNGLSGSLPSGFLTDIPSTLQVLSLDLSDNDFGGVFSADFLAPFTSIPRISLQLGLINCGLTGSLPTNLFGQITTGVSLFVDSNSISGAFDYNGLLSNASSNGFSWLDLSASNNELSGLLDIPSVARSYALNLNLSHNQLSSLNVSTAAIYIKSLDVSHNIELAGKLPQIVFDASSQLLLFNASNTALSGDFPLVSGDLSLAIQTLDLSDTLIDFCSGSRSIWSVASLTTCRLSDTNASSCSSAYPSICSTSEAAPQPKPVAPPTSGARDTRRGANSASFLASVAGPALLLVATQLFL